MGRFRFLAVAANETEKKAVKAKYAAPVKEWATLSGAARRKVAQARNGTVTKKFINRRLPKTP